MRKTWYQSYWMFLAAWFPTPSELGFYEEKIIFNKRKTNVFAFFLLRTAWFLCKSQLSKHSSSSASAMKSAAADNAGSTQNVPLAVSDGEILWLKKERKGKPQESSQGAFRKFLGAQWGPSTGLRAELFLQEMPIAGWDVLIVMQQRKRNERECCVMEVLLLLGQQWDLESWNGLGW